MNLSIDSTSRIERFDLLRCFAILYIVGLWHIKDYVSNMFLCTASELTMYVTLGIFVFMSGYLTSRSYSANATTSKSYSTFLARRFIRIYPLYAFSGVLFLITGLITIRELICQLLLIDMILSISCATLWFVSMTCLFYIVFPFLVSRFNLSTFFLRSLAVVVVIIVLRTCFNIVDTRLMLYFPVFLFGVITERKQLLHYICRRNVVILCTLLGISVCLLYINYDRSYIKFILQIIFINSCVPPLLFLAGIYPNTENNQIISRLSYSSFCMYLLHRPIFDVLLRFYNPISDIHRLCYLILIGLPLTFISAYVTQAGYDGLRRRYRAYALQ